MMKKLKHHNSGFVLLYAVLVSGIILSVGLSLMNLITKQITLSSIGRNSQFAYYAADAGKRCAFYWYASYYPVFGAPANGEMVEASELRLPIELFKAVEGGGIKIYCEGKDIAVAQEKSDDNLTLTSKFNLDVNAGDQISCVLVEVERKMDQATEEVNTKITSRGYNSACADLNNANARRIERVTYQIL